MPEPIVTFNLVDKFFDENKIENDSEKISNYKSLLDQLPPPNRETLGELMKLCSKTIASFIMTIN